MTNYEEEAGKQFGELSQKIEKLQAKKSLTFSDKALPEFCRGFFFSILGLLSHLQNTKTHRIIQCIAQCDQLGDITITDDNSYEYFSTELNGITPPAGVNFTFNLTDCIYPTGDVSETLSVHFTNTEYKIVYENVGEEPYELTKPYMSHIEADEIIKLRDLISKKIIKKVSHKLDALL